VHQRQIGNHINGWVIGWQEKNKMDYKENAEKTNNIDTTLTFTQMCTNTQN